MPNFDDIERWLNNPEVGSKIRDAARAVFGSLTSRFAKQFVSELHQALDADMRADNRLRAAERLRDI